MLELVKGKHYLVDVSTVLGGAPVWEEMIYDSTTTTNGVLFSSLTGLGACRGFSPDVWEKYVKDIPIKNTDGVKYDGNKLLWDLLPLEPVQEIVRVLTYGAKKYTKDNWKYVADSKERYYAAMMRHITAWRLGEKFDLDTTIHHLAHAGCCLIFLLWFELTGWVAPKPEDKK